MTVPRTMPILGMLSAAPEGMTTSAMTRAFSEPSQLQPRANKVNGLLKYQLYLGHVTRSEKTEASLVYNNVPTYRWFITPKGREYYESGGYEGRIARGSNSILARQKRETEERRRIYDEKLKPLQAIRVPEDKEERDKVVRYLRSEGLTLADVGRIVGMSRERVRQICEPVRR